MAHAVQIPSIGTTLHLDDDHEGDIEDVTDLASKAEKVDELESEKEELSSENESLREWMVGETIRRKKQGGELNDEGVEEEREYLEGLSADRLTRELERAPTDLDTSASTEEGKHTSDESKYEELGLVN